ncbi:zinc-binding dehydrogenase [Aeromicrobium ginsengisoli]|uniref:Zinc-binding dehydrogenase n=1 Tax=Aeromicrobium ginsengisoli TaxID=363867 RepID=A0A5M4FES7_9ACTN|nr:zinc-binding dehydrogenase [Aeromicrobium ginsengisoli]KAA1397857.1 zinc-binding dehydrogenase [Aeromicrobium ginsengisoli]
MHAIRQYELGGPEVLRYEEVPDLVPGEGQVRIAVSASGVHVLDTALRAGFTSAVHQPLQLPMTPGREVAGRVDAIGPGVDGAWSGKRVVAHLGMASGGYAEQALAAAESLHEIPDGMPCAVAVASIGTGRTAAGILDQSPIRPDDVVIVTSAAGGLGVLLVQAAKEAGALVVGLAGGEDKVAIARAQGADIAVDYRIDGWDDVVRRELGGDWVTLVLDGVGGKTADAAYGLLATGGRLMQYGWFTDEPATYDDPTRTVRMLLGPQMLARPGGLRSLEAEALARAADGSRVPLADAAFALSDAAGAHRALEGRHTYGKVVLIPDALR